MEQEQENGEVEGQSAKSNDCNGTAMARASNARDKSFKNFPKSTWFVCVYVWIGLDWIELYWIRLKEVG